MGKNFCKVENKWCKFLRHDVCEFTNAKTNICDVSRCPRLAAIETTRLSTLLQEVKFEDVFKELTYWFTDQEKSKEGYRDVFNKLLAMKPKKHNLSDLFINIEVVNEDDGNWLNVDGVNVIGNDHKTYGIEFLKWEDWVSMFITTPTLQRLPKETIVAGCLYEMTFFGFEQESVQGYKEKLINSIEEVKSNSR